MPGLALFQRELPGSGIVQNVAGTTHLVPDSKQSFRLKPQIVYVQLRENYAIAANSLALKLLLKYDVGLKTDISQHNVASLSCFFFSLQAKKVEDQR